MVARHIRADLPQLPHATMTAPANWLPALALLLPLASCGLLPPSQSVRGELGDTLYVAPDRDFSVRVPFVHLHERRWMEVHELESGDQQQIRFGPTPQNQSVYRLNVMRLQSRKPPEDLRMLVEKIAGKIVPHLEQSSGAEMRMLEDRATTIDGKPAWFRRYEQTLAEAYPHADTGPTKIHHRWVFVSNRERAWSAWRQWVENGREVDRNGNLSVEQFAASVRFPQR